MCAPTLILFVLCWATAGVPGAQSIGDTEVRQHFRAAKQAEKAGDFDKAAAEYLILLKLHPEDGQIYNNLGLVYYLQRRYRDAIQVFQQGLKRNPKLLGANLFLGISYFRTNQFEQALRPLQEAVTLSPQDLQGHLYLGMSCMELGRLEEALRQVQTAVQLAPKDIDALYTLGQVYAKLMTATYAQMGQLDRDSYRVHQVLAQSYEAQRDSAKAVEEYKAVIARRPNLPGIHYALGNVYWKDLKFQEAEKEFKEELEIDPENYIAVWKLGNTYLVQNRWDEAMPYLQKAISLNPNLAQAHRDLEKVLFQKGDLEGAIEECKKVSQLAPDEDTVHYRLAMIYRRQGRKAESQAEMQIFEKLNQKAREVKDSTLSTPEP